MTQKKKTTSKKNNAKKIENVEAKVTPRKTERVKQPVKSNKKTTICIILGILVVMFLGFYLNKGHITYKGLEVHHPEENLEFDTFLEKVQGRNDNKLVFLTLFMDTKIDATLYKKMIEEEITTKYNFDEYYIYYTNEMTKEENRKLEKFLGNPVNAYPMTFIIKNGKVINNIWGYQVMSSYEEALQGIIENLDEYIIETKDENN